MHMHILISCICLSLNENEAQLFKILRKSQGLISKKFSVFVCQKSTLLTMKVKFEFKRFKKNALPITARLFLNKLRKL